MKMILSLLAASLLGAAAQAAPVQVFDPTGFQKTLEVEIEVERKPGRFEVEAEIEYEARDADGKKIKDSKVKFKNKSNFDEGSPLEFQFSILGAVASLEATIAGMGMNGSITMDPLSALNLLELELKLETDKKEAVGSSVGRLTSLSLNGVDFVLGDIAAPFLDDKGKVEDEAKAKWFFGLPDKGVFGDLVIAGMIDMSGPWKEYELKLKLGQATDFSVPLAPVAPVPLPAAGWMLLSALIGLGVIRRKA